MSLLVRNGTILTMNDAWDIVTGDVWIDGDRIAGVGQVPDGFGTRETIDAEGGLVVPGFIQTHIHLCQTLFRGAADDLPLLAWLRERIWPLEAAHDARTLGAAARLAAAELLRGGTTSVLTMETVHDTDAVFEALVPTGLRAVIGKCLMDAGDGLPARLRQPMRDGLDESLALHRRWDGAAGGRLSAAIAPRFALSCSRELLEAAGRMAEDHGLLVHTHAAEQREEVAEVRARTGLDNVAYLASLGLVNDRLCAAHCVWVTDAEQGLLAERAARVLHCPGSNLKLGSGIAPVRDLQARGIPVSLGADGAACNNTLDMFHEMRLAATLQAFRYGPGALPAREVVRMATREGARALGLEQRTGSIEVGKDADLVVVGLDRPHHRPLADPYSTLVYACTAGDVRATVAGGRIVARDGLATWADDAELLSDAEQARRMLRQRAGV